MPDRFGFLGPEIFPVDSQISQLREGDFNSDGLKDLLVVNNSRSKITFLYNQTGKTNLARKKEPAHRRELNELPIDARFYIESIASEKRIASLVVSDFNSDSRPDLAYYGEPRELITQLNQGTNGWGFPKRWPIDDGQITPNALVSGDLNGDRLTDLVLLGEGHFYLFFQEAGKTLAEPEKIAFSGTVRGLQILDLNGDGRDDLLLVHGESDYPLRFRLQDPSGRLGPEIYFSLPAIRSYWAQDLDRDRKAEIVTIAHHSGRAQVSTFIQKAPESFTENFEIGQLNVLPLNRTSRARRGQAWGDINQDGLSDFLVADPESGQITLYQKESNGRLGPPKTFPTLTGISELLIAKTNKEGSSVVLVLSSDERQIGVSGFDGQGRLLFPSSLALDGRPLNMAWCEPAKEVGSLLAVLVEQENGRVLWTRKQDGTVSTQKLQENFKSNPSSMSFHDINQDGLKDLVILIPYEKIKILLASEKNAFEEIDIASPAGAAEQPWHGVADVDGDGKNEMLVAQKNFVRAVVLQREPSGTGGKSVWSFKVKDQINGNSNNSKIVGAAPLSSPSNSLAALCLLDADKKVLSFLQRNTNGLWTIVRNVTMPIADFFAMESLSGTQNTSRQVALMGLNTAAWIALEGTRWELQELDGYETPVKDGRLNDVTAGDLNHDGREDLVFLETAKNHVDLVLFEKPHRLTPGNRWQVFEERTFRSRRGDTGEPREALVADFTQDGKNDLVVLVHDRILLYPQE